MPFRQLLDSAARDGTIDLGGGCPLALVAPTPPAHAVGVIALAACGAGHGRRRQTQGSPCRTSATRGRLPLNIEWPFTDYRYATSDHMAQLTSGSPDPTDMTGGPPAGGYINAVSPDGSRVAFDSNDTAYQASDTLTVLGPDGNVIQQPATVRAFCARRSVEACRFMRRQR